ncbi:porin [Tardiphaga sp.]|uniref:porin n=1 Tax=Tardiphaga sp. TaxID=1926292 RepID=UPI0025D5D4AC|nr:porin [Tardiphaga sp.]
MTMIKSLVLGSTAGLIALSGAQAADLPVKAKAVEYVRICSLYGAGFNYIPGTDTCIKIGGAIRLDTTFNGAIYDAPYWQGGAGGANSYNKNNFATRERVNATLDTRTATEYGVVRTYSNLQFDFTQGVSNIAGGAIAEVDFAFIQFAGFTFGKAVSQFDPQWALSKPYITSGFLAGSNNATGIPQLAYTASFGNGISATISVEDSQPYRTAGVVNASTGFLGPFGANVGGATVINNLSPYAANSFIGNAAGGDQIPDIVGNVRLDQAWGSMHFGAAAHQVHGTWYPNTAISGASGNPGTPNQPNGHPDDTWGYAVTGAIELKNLPTGVGDSFKLESTFGHGAAKYVFGGTFDSTGAGRFAKLGGNGTMGFGYVLDGVYSGLGAGGGATATGIQLSNAWDVSAFYEHYWNPAWRTSVFASYSAITYGAGANAALRAVANSTVPGAGFINSTVIPQTTLTATVPTGSVSTGSFNGTNTGNFDISFVQVGTKTAWTPVKDLTLSAEFIYTKLYQNQNGVYTSNGAVIAGQGTAATYTMSNQSFYNGSVQILRSF